MTSGELLTLGLYLMQQLGVVLGVGAAILSLVAHLVAARDGVIDASEARFARMVERATMVGLFCMIASGVAITVIHSFSGQAAIVFAPAYLFKWLLLFVVALPLIVGHASPFPKIWFEGFVGATWFALFALRIIAPIASWIDLMLLYLGWTGVFLVTWGVLARQLTAGTFSLVQGALTQSIAQVQLRTQALAKTPAPEPTLAPKLPTPAPKPQPVAAPKPVPKPVPTPVVPPMPKPVVVAAAPAPHKPIAGVAPHKPAELPPPHALLPTKPPTPAVPAKPVAPVRPALAVPAKPPQKPEFTSNLDENPFLPGIRVMPRTPEDVDKQMRPAVVQFS